MNKFVKFTALILIMTALFSFTACKEIENGIEIKRVKITLSLAEVDDDNPAVSCDVYAKFYVNYAPETFKHIETLIKSGYYNGLNITNINDNYCTFGDYDIVADGNKPDGNVKAKDQGEPVNGEFYDNGFPENPMTIKNGSILLVHDKGDYNSGKATLAVAFNASIPYNNNKYCVFGEIVSDDGDKDADKDSMEYKSSLERFELIKKRISGSNGRKVYYCINKDKDDKFDWEGKYITYAELKEEESEEEKAYYLEGIVTQDDLDMDKISNKIIEDAELDDLKAKMDKHPEYFLTIPAYSVKIEKIEFVK